MLNIKYKEIRLHGYSLPVEMKIKGTHSLSSIYESARQVKKDLFNYGGNFARYC